MATVELIMPKLGESIMEATILKWLKQPGDFVKMDETVLEIATDNVDSEVPSTTEVVLEEILFDVNDVVPVGAVIARIKTSAEEESFSDHVINVPQKEQGTRHKMQEAAAVETSSATTNYKPPTTNSNGRFYSPLVLNIAASEGVSMTELENIPGTGNEARVTKKDILQYVSQRKLRARSRESRVISSQESEAVYETPQLRTLNSEITT